MTIFINIDVDLIFFAAFSLSNMYTHQKVIIALSVTCSEEVREGFWKTKWKFEMEFSIKRRTLPPPNLAQD